MPVTVDGIASTAGVVDALVADDRVWLYWVDNTNTICRSLSVGNSFTSFNGNAEKVRGFDIRGLFLDPKEARFTDKLP
jgi:hypothetical protein